MKLINRVEKLEKAGENGFAVIVRELDDPDNETAIRRAGYDPDDNRLFIVVQNFGCKKLE